MRDASQSTAERLVELARVARLAFPAYDRSSDSEQRFSAREAQALVAAYALGQPTVGQMGQALGVNPSTLDGPLKALGRAGLLERTVDAKDARRRLVRLTPAGCVEARDFVEAADARLRDARDSASDGLKTT